MKISGSCVAELRATPQSNLPIGVLREASQQVWLVCSDVGEPPLGCLKVALVVVDVAQICAQHA